MIAQHDREAGQPKRLFEQMTGNQSARNLSRQLRKEIHSYKLHFKALFINDQYRIGGFLLSLITLLKTPSLKLNLEQFYFPQLESQLSELLL